MEFCLQDAKHLPKTNKTTQQECCLLGIKLMEISRDTWLLGQSSIFPSIKQRDQHCVHTASLCLLGRQIISGLGSPSKHQALSARVPNASLILKRKCVLQYGEIGFFIIAIHLICPQFATRVILLRQFKSTIPS